jgi:hypothetical protein
VRLKSGLSHLNELVKNGRFDKVDIISLLLQTHWHYYCLTSPTLRFNTLSD